MNKIVILAAGKGSRMNSDLPKVLVPLSGKPMIVHLVDSIQKSGVDKKPILVVSPDNIDIISNALSDYDTDYAIQEEQLGSGHAVGCARDKVDDDILNIIVFYGDHPLIQPDTIERLAKSHKDSGKKVTMMTTKVEDFNDWRKNFEHWGRIVRQNGNISQIIEFKDASEQQREITEVNPALFCFDREWLWNNIEQLENNNVQKEYYLTDLIQIAFDQGEDINDIQLDPQESLGANSIEELELIEKVAKEVGLIK